MRPTPHLTCPHPQTCPTSHPDIQETQEDVTSLAGKAQLAGTEIWVGGPKWGEVSGDAQPDLPDVRKNQGDPVGKFDIYFPDYHPQFWGWTQSGFDEQRKAQGVDYQCQWQQTAQRSATSTSTSPTTKSAAGSSAGSPGPSVPTEPLKELWPELNGKGFFLQWHGSNPVSAITMLTMNAGHRSEDETGKGMPLQHEGFEATGLHRGIYTSKYLEKVMPWAAPLWSDDNTEQEALALTKIVLLVTIREPTVHLAPDRARG